MALNPRNRSLEELKLRSRSTNQDSVRHWLQGVVEESEARGELGQEGRHRAAFFYVDDGMVASSESV